MESEEAVGNTLGAEGGAYAGAVGGLRLSDSLKSSGSSSSRLMSVFNEKLSKKLQVHSEAACTVPNGGMDGYEVYSFPESREPDSPDWLTSRPPSLQSPVLCIFNMSYPNAG